MNMWGYQPPRRMKRITSKVLMSLRRAFSKATPNTPPLRQKPKWGEVSWHSNRHALRNTKGRKVRSKIRWFTEFCNSHYLSHFAAFFIDARAKRSVVKSFVFVMILHSLLTVCDGRSHSSRCVRMANSEEKALIWTQLTEVRGHY